MAKVIVVASGKGGTGKSTISAGLATALAKQGFKALLIDCDSGMRGVDIMLNLATEIVYDLSDVVAGKCKMDQCVYSSRALKNLSLIPAPFESDDEISPTLFSQIVDKIKKHFDFIIIDSPAGVGTGFMTAATPADSALLIANTEPTSLSGCQKIRKKLISLGIKDIRLIINKFNRNSFDKIGLYYDLDEIIDIVGAQLIGVVPEDYVMIANLQKGQVDGKASPAAQALKNISIRMQGKRVSLGIK